MAGAPGSGAWTTALSTPEVHEAFRRARVVRHVHPVAEVGSTQDVARDLAARGLGPGTLVLAECQTAGRGRRGRPWDDHPEGRTLAVTVLLEAGMFPQVGIVPHGLGVAVVEACRAVVPRAVLPRLKWPNDVVHRGPDGRVRKLAGVLIEREQVPTPAGIRDVLLCGLGLDVDLRDVDVPDDRTCLATLAGQVPDRGALLSALIAAIDDAVLLLEDPPALLDRYRSVSDTIGRAVRVEPFGEAPFEGVVEAIDDSGRMIVSTGSGSRTIISATVRDVADPTGTRV